MWAENICYFRMVCAAVAFGSWCVEMLFSSHGNFCQQESNATPGRSTDRRRSCALRPNAWKVSIESVMDGVHTRAHTHLTGGNAEGAEVGLLHCRKDPALAVLGGLLPLLYMGKAMSAEWSLQLNRVCHGACVPAQYTGEPCKVKTRAHRQLPIRVASAAMAHAPNQHNTQAVHAR